MSTADSFTPLTTEQLNSTIDHSAETVPSTYSLSSSTSAPQEELQQLRATLHQMQVDSAKRMSSPIHPSPLSRPHSTIPNNNHSNIAPTSSSSLRVDTTTTTTSKNSIYSPKVAHALASSRSNLSTSSNQTPLAASSSKAVLSALRALQDKCARVEAEKESALKRVAELKVESRKHEAALESASQQNHATLTQSRESARAAYEALRSEKDQLKLQVVTLEERVRASEAEGLHLQSHLRSVQTSLTEKSERLILSEEKLMKAKDELTRATGVFEYEVSQLKAQVKSDKDETQARTDQVETLTNELQTSQRLVTSLKSQLTMLQEGMKNVVSSSTKRSSTLKKSKKRSSGGGGQFVLPKKITGRIVRKTNASVHNTNTHRSTSTTKKPTRMAYNRKKKKNNSIIKKNIAITPSATGKRIASSINNNMEMLREANKGNVPFLLGSSTSPSFSVIASVQEMMRHSDSYAAVAPDRKSAVPDGHRPVMLQRKAKQEVESGRRLHVRVPDIPATRHNTTSPYAENPPPNTVFQASAPPPPPMPPAVVVQSNTDTSLSLAVSSIEAEFEALSKRYKTLVSTNSNDNSTEEKEDEKCESDLNDVIESLEDKGRQLYWMRHAQSKLSSEKKKKPSPSTFPSYERCVVHSPEAVRRKTAALSLLRTYRDLDPLTKN